MLVTIKSISSQTSFANLTRTHRDTHTQRAWVRKYIGKNLFHNGVTRFSLYLLKYYRLFIQNALAFWFSVD